MKTKLLLLSSLCLFQFAAQAATPLTFTGQLIAEPCHLDVNSIKSIDFGNQFIERISDGKMSKDVTFKLNLEDCSADTLNNVAVRFSGAADTTLTEYFKLDDTSTAKGLAIGIKDDKGAAVKPNGLSTYKAITDGEMSLAFNAFVVGDESANITGGDFTTTVNVELEYN